MTTFAEAGQAADAGPEVDWAEFAERYWERQPVRLPAKPPADLRSLYGTTVEACAPFRAGTRFRMKPNVTFLLGDGWLRAPGGRLPHAGDRTVDDYHDRVDREAAGHGYLLTVEQPLLLDFALWSAVRETIAGLWREVGWPNLPLVAEVLIGDSFTQHAGVVTAPEHAVMTWVLRGTMRVRLWDDSAGPAPAAVADPDQELAGVRSLEASAGELLYWPAAYRHADTYTGRCVALRLRVPLDRRLPVTAVRDLLADLVHARHDHDETVPYFPFGPASAIDDPGGVLTHLTSLGDELRDVVESEELRRTLCVRWAALRSAAGLEPIPAPREAVTLTLESRIRLASEIVRMPDRPGQEVWAVNGHFFALPSAAAARVFAQLRSSADTGVAELRRIVGVQDPSSMLALVDKLYRLRAVEVVR